MEGGSKSLIKMFVKFKKNRVISEDFNIVAVVSTIWIKSVIAKRIDHRLTVNIPRPVKILFCTVSHYSCFRGTTKHNLPLSAPWDSSVITPKQVWSCAAVLFGSKTNALSRDGTVVRALAFHQCGPGFDSRSRCHMWVEFVVGSRPCSERFFSGYSGFPLSSKTNTSKFQFDLGGFPN